MSMYKKELWYKRDWQSPTSVTLASVVNAYGLYIWGNSKSREYWGKCYAFGRNDAILPHSLCLLQILNK